MVKLLKTNDDDEAENPSSAQVVASIDDLLTDIIQRLPSKPLAQLKLVSNYWNSIIPKLHFLRNRPAVGLIFEGLNIADGYIYTTSNHRHSYIIFLDKSVSPPFRKITPIKDSWYRHCEILQSCNGLLLCVSNEAYNITRKYYVCNPTTRKYMSLPQVILRLSMLMIRGRVLDHSALSKPMIRGMYLAFDRSMSPHYKVVCVLGSSLGVFGSSLGLGRLSYLFKVYSSETGLWRKGGKMVKVDADFDFEDGVYWNGAIHWVNIVTKRRESVYFNLDCDQTLKLFPKPPLQDKSYGRKDYYFGESCDHLLFVDGYRSVTEFNVYEMKRDYSEWFVKYKFNVPDTWIISQCAVVLGKNDEDSFLVFAIGKRIARYDFNRKTCETLCDFESTVQYRPLFWSAKRPFQYIESLCSV